LGDAVAVLEAVDEHHCRFRIHPETAEWLAARLASLGHPFHIEAPPELVTRLRALAHRLTEAVT
jgi:hypothetical protein